MIEFSSNCFQLLTSIVILGTISFLGNDVNGQGLLNDKVCYGTSNGFSMSGNARQRYKRMKAKYSKCRFVHGNLEITHLEREADMTFDLSFLEDIEVVTGYILILNTDVDVIPLTSLKHIRGETLFEFKGKRFALSVFLSYNIDGLHMPAIKEITGNVLVSHGSVCYANTIAWDVFTSGSVSMFYEKNNNCGECDAACTDADGVRRCWGAGPDLCQTVNRIECSWFCQNGTCYEEGMLGCCHPECVGCNDGWINTACEHCRHYVYQGHCIPTCPPETYPNMDKCIQYEDKNISS